jgi:predicted Zn finger-like uncharacterized protein
MGLEGLIHWENLRREDQIMIVQCEQCMAKYRLDDSRIPGEKAKVKCSRCQHVFLVSKDNTPYEEPTMLLSLQEGPEESSHGSFQEPPQEPFQQPYQASFQCPNCGFQQPHSEECMKCGIIFSKYKPRTEMPPPPPYGAGGFGLDKHFIDEQVETSTMTYAGFWRRLGAYLIDGIVVGIIMKISTGVMMIPLSRYFSNIYLSNDPHQLEAMVPSMMIILVTSMLVGMSLQALYFILMWGYRGATLGKMALKIKIVHTGGSDISYGSAFLRYIGTIISGIPLCLGYLWMLWDDKKQTWHDKIASTCVIRT